MRNEQEMYELLLGFAQKEPRIRAVYMNGSRTNPNAKRDIFQDFDIVYVVTDVASFVRDKSWLTVFGEIAVMQEPDATALPYEKTKPEDGYAYLMQFEDGNRIDLTLQSISAAKNKYREDSLTRPLLDKDGLLPEIPEATDKDYRISKPNAAQYASCCNEFWWVSPYIAKGLWRKEILFALDHLDKCVRPMLQMMLTWQAGILTDFSVSAGKCGKYLDRFLPEETWTRLLKTYPTADPDSVWKALFEAGSLFRETAMEVGHALHFTYNEEEDRRTTALLADIRKLPEDAEAIR